MQGVPATIANSGDDGMSAQSHQQPPQSNLYGGRGELGHEGGSVGGGYPEEGDRNSGGNRWPKQETLALIKIRSEMDAAFRDSNLKGPLWDDVSRKLSELGFHRSAKKCREKFENVYKYHRRTKEGRSSKSDKIYRFSDQLVALEANPRGAFPPLLAAAKPPPVLAAMPNNATVPSIVSPFNLTGSDKNNAIPISVAASAVVIMPPLPVMNHKRTFPFSRTDLSESTNSGSSSDTFSDDEPPRKKQKWEDFFGKLIKEVIVKQEELQRKFLDKLERQERDRVAWEETWRAREIAKMNQEHDRLVKERSIAAAKDAALITYLQKMTEKHPDVVPLTGLLAPTITTPLMPTIHVTPQQQIHLTVQQQSPSGLPRHDEVAPVVVPQPPTVVKNVDDGGGTRVENNMLFPTPSRWPKAEINALINLRTQLGNGYQERVPKGPLWEDISSEMKKLGYNRNAKRCKEKWENINKYYKKMKEGNKKKWEDSKTCPYFHQLDAIYSEKLAIETKMTTTPIVPRPEKQGSPPPTVQEKTTSNMGFTVKPETYIAPVVPWREQQWRVPETRQQASPTAAMEDNGSENDDDYDDDEEDEDEEDKEGGGGGYEIVPSKVSSMAAI